MFKRFVVSGTKKNDNLTGTDRLDIIFGKKGNDVLDGRGGKDFLFGDKGDDTLFGGDGNDFLFGGKGKDQLFGDDGNDFLFGGKGNDFLDGGAGSDYLFGDKGNDTFNFTLSENSGAKDYYDGGKGRDTLQLTLTSAELKLESVQKDIADFEAFLARKGNSHSDDGKVFQFKSFDLDVKNFEKLVIVEVGGGGSTAPTADDDSFTFAEDSENVVLDVLNGDADLDGDSLTPVIVDGPLNGTLSQDANGVLTYTPKADFFGNDQFTYRASDGSALSNLATVSLTITPVNDAPVANPDSYSTNKNTTLIVPVADGVLSDDIDVDDDTLSALLVSGPTNGTLSLNSDGSFTYMPNTNFFGTDAFSYKANDGSVDSNEAVVTLAVNVPPVAKNDVIERTGAGGPIHVAVLAGAQNSAADTVTQLNNKTTPFAIIAKTVDVANDSTTNWSAVLAQYDVVVVGESGFAPFDYDGSPNLFTALVESFVATGHGVVSTGVFANKIGGYINPIVNARADDISPTGTFGDSIFAPSGSVITVDPSHPITAGITTPITTSGFYELANKIDPENLNHILATGGQNNDAAIVYADNVGPEMARTVFLGAIHMAGSALSPDWTRVPGSPVDQILKQAIAWATGTATDEDTPLVIDSATLLANDEQGSGGPLTIASVSATSARGASVSLDIDGNVVYDPTVALNDLTAGQIVEDSFDYRVMDSNGAEAFATASLSVAGRDEVM